jgi:NAD-dependent SIR2 family protein deacetylase
MIKSYKTVIVPDDSQLQLTQVAVSCNACGRKYTSGIALELKNKFTKCPNCTRVQKYTKK